MLVDNLRQVEVLLAIVRHQLVERQQICQQNPSALVISQLKPHSGDDLITN